MRIMTLNMDMFKKHMGNSFSDLFDEYKPDISIVQECRYTNIEKKGNSNYLSINPCGFELNKAINGRYFITVGFVKTNEWERKQKPTKLDKMARAWVEIFNSQWDVLGIHIPADTVSNSEKLKNMIECLKEKDNCDIICGDFNASERNKASMNKKYLDDIIKKGIYKDMWEEGIRTNKAYYIDYQGREHQVTKHESNTCKTFVGGRHIDYMLAANNIELEKIVIDMRTLVFTDHCAVIMDCNKK